jgi:hypothetical protein
MLRIEIALITGTGGCHGTPRRMDALWGWSVMEDVVAADAAVVVAAPGAV